MFNRRKLQDEIVRLNYRVKELENILCPFESHQFKTMGYHFQGGSGMGDELTVYHYKCQKCGKEVNDWRRID